MDILKIPFHQFLNIQRPATGNALFVMDEKPECLNHIGTWHACVQLALAEASAGEFLLQAFQEHASEYVPVVRSTEVKYHTAAQGTLYSRCAFGPTGAAEALHTLQEKNRTLLKTKCELYDAQHTKVLTAWFEWFIAKK